MIVLDRVEGERAILEVDGEIVELPRSALPASVVEGSVLSLVVDVNGTAVARQEAEARLERLRQRDDGAMEINL